MPVNLRMTGWLNKEEAGMDAGILDVAVSLRGKFLSEERRVLVLNIFDNWVPATRC